MKDASGPITNQGNIDTSNSKALTISAAAGGKLMSLFSNQYSNGPLAVVREYWCNGDDARRSAKSDRPTEVFLPTELNPVLIVRDFGTGLDQDGLETTFSTYGESTKDDEDDSTGHFGIGSKAAFTLASQFIVTGYKDGHFVSMLFYLDVKGAPRNSLQAEGPTTEPNGVKVEVGVPNVQAMVRSATEFFLTVPKGLALVDGKAPAHLSDTVEHSQFNDDVTLVKDGLSRVRLQMGPVVYRVSREILQAVSQRLEGLASQAIADALANWDSSDSVLMTVPMGTVTIAPSREDLRDTDATLNRVADIVQGISDYVHGGVQAKIDAAPSYYQAMLVLRDALIEMKGFKVKRSSFTFNGVEKPFQKEITLDHPVFFLSAYSYRSTRKVVGREDKHLVDFSRAEKTLVVTGVPRDETSKVSRYAKRFLESQSQIEFIMVSEQTRGGIGWFQYGTKNSAPSMTLDEYRAALRAMRDSDPRRATEPSYTVGWGETASRDLDDRDLLTDIVAEGKPVIIFAGASPAVESWAREILDLLYTPVVLLPQQSKAALLKRIEKDGTVDVFTGDWKAPVAAKVQAEVSSPTDDERLALGAANWLKSNIDDYWGRKNNWVKNLIAATGGYPTPLAHPAIADALETEELARLIAADLTEDRTKELNRLQRWCGVEFQAIEFEAGTTNIDKVFPLFVNGIDTHNLQRNKAYRREVISYINSKA